MGATQPKTQDEKIFTLAHIFLIILVSLIIIVGLIKFKFFVLILPFLLMALIVLAVTLLYPTVPLYLYIMILPFQYLIMMILFGVLKLPPRLILVLSSWKEILILVVILTALIHSLQKKSFKLTLTFVDVLMVIFLVYGLFHFVVPDSFLGVESSLNLKLYGFKADFLFVFIYFAGRTVSLTKRNIHFITKLLIFIGLFTAIIGIIEVLFINEQIFVKLGYQEYTNDYLGIFYNGKYGLADNFWTDFGGISLRRSVSVYMSAQPFSQSFLLIIPITLVLLFNPGFRKKKLLSVALLIMLLALLMTITRAVIIMCSVQIALLGVLLKKWNTTVILTLFSFLILIFVMVTPNFFAFIERTINLEDPSALGHIRMWERSITYFQEHPLFGVGLGMAGETSQRFQGLEAGGESEYFVYASELGLIGLTLYCVIFLSVLKRGFRAFFKTKEPYTKNFILAVTMCGLGILIVSTISYTRGAIFGYFIFWWLAGYLVRVQSNPHDEDEILPQIQECA
jgi:O-antigen ligase